MQQFKNVDVEHFLEQVMKSNTTHYQSDFEIDKKIFDAALKSEQSRDKYLLWLSRGNGTHCLKETEVLIKFTSAYNTWMHWAEPKRDDEKFVAFAIHITGKNNGKPTADLYELDYNTHAELIKQNAVDAVEKIIHFQNGDIHLDLSAPTTIPTDINYGEYVSTEYIPKDSILFEERIRQMRNSYENLPEGKIEEYLSSIGDEPFRFVIWSDLNLDYEEGIEFAKENYPNEPEDKLIQRYIEENQEMLETERINLDIQYNQPIIIIGDLGLWNGRAHGYKDVASGNIKDCLYSDTDMTEWFVDEKGDLRAEAAHHDGTNYYLYRVFKDNVTEDQIDDFKDKIYDGILTETDIEKYTRSLGIAYGEDSCRKLTEKELAEEQTDVEPQQKINVLICEPMTAPYMKEIDSGLESMQATVGGLIQAIYPFEDEVALVCNEEGKLEGLMLNRAVYGENGEMIDIIAGTFFIAGLTEDSFGSLTPELAEKYGNLFQFPEIFVREGDEIKALPIKPSVRDKLKTNTAEIKKESSEKAHNKSEHEI